MTEPCIVNLPRILDERGNLSFIEQWRQVPFKIERTYWIYDVPGGEMTRTGHAYRVGHELIVALSGSFDVTVDTGSTSEKFSLNRSYYGLYVPAGTWRALSNFSTNSLALVLSSTPYDETDYIRDYDEFVAMKANHATDTDRPTQAPTPTDAASFDTEAFKRLTVFDCSIIEFPKITERAGNITPVHPRLNVPFDLRRVFYTYDIPAGMSRGDHAHRCCHELLVAASGSFEVVLDDGVNRRTVTLNRPYYGLHIPPGIWAIQQSYSSGSICLVLTSDPYEADDYIHDYQEFLNLK